MSNNDTAVSRSYSSLIKNGTFAFETTGPRLLLDDGAAGILGISPNVSPEQACSLAADGILPECREVFDKWLGMLTSGDPGAALECSFHRRRADGEVRELRVYGTAVETDGGRRIEGMINDTTGIYTITTGACMACREAGMFTDAFTARLINEYAGVYFVDLDNGALTTLKYHESMEWGLDRCFVLANDYSEAIRGYTEGYIYPDDRAVMLEECSIENIRRRLASEDSFSVPYRNTELRLPRYSEAHIIRADSADRPTVAAVAFKLRDREISTEYTYSNLLSEYASIFLVDLENDNYRFISRTAESGFPDEPGGSYSRTILEYASRIHPDYREQWLQMSDPAFMREYLAKDDRREYSYILTGIDRRWRRCVSQVVERRDGVPVMFVMTYMTLDASSAEKFELDKKVAEQKAELEQQRALLENALARAEAANRAKTVFLSNMSHDIRTPMNAIIGYTNLAIQHRDDREKVVSYLKKTAVSSQHLLSLINDILDMSRIESGKIQLEEIDCNIADIMHDLNTIILGQAGAKQQKLFMDSIDITDEDVVCDKLRLHQVLINLLSNAVKFTPVGGQIEVSVRQTASYDDTADYEFRVKDNGIGMSPAFVEHIFEPFERERTSTVSRAQGTGLGMAITKNIVDLMGGTIEVHSEQGHGTEFVVRLNMKRRACELELSDLEEFRCRRALIVDDDQLSCESVSRHLEKLGIRAEYATSTDKALELLRSTCGGDDPYCAYFIDYLMPGMTGMELAARVREAVGGDLPIIMTTAYDWVDIEDEARQAGFNAFMTKPIFTTSLHRVLTRFARGIPEEVSVPDAPDFAGRKLLLVEDNELNREIAIDILETHGFIVDSAEDGSIAVEKVRVAPADAYDIILMDIQMPIMDGYEATRRIRALDCPLANVPIIAMTANAFAEDRRAALDAGMNEHIAKPIDVDKLSEVLAEFLS